MSDEILGPGPVPLALRVNGQAYPLQVEPRETLLAVVRDRLHLTGAKESCGAGTCGACTVLLDGVPRYACLTLALEADGRDVTTIEGLGGDHPVQTAFVRHDAVQCGFCTPGQVLAVVALLAGTPDPTPAQIQTATAGNLCRCGTYPKIVAAALDAAAAMRQTGTPATADDRGERTR